MTTHNERQKERRGRAARALRAAGYAPLPRWWIPIEDMDAIERLKDIHSEEVNRIRAKALGYTKGEDNEK